MYRDLTHKRECCENNIQRSVTTMGWWVHRILKNKTVGIHHLVNKWDNFHNGLTSSATGVALRCSLYRDNERAPKCHTHFDVEYHFRSVE